MPKAKPDTLKQLRADMEARLRPIEKATSLFIATQKLKPVEQSVADGAKVELTEAALAAGVRLLPGGTWQFPNAPTGPVVEHPPASTPALPKEYGVGAVVRRVGSIETDTVWQVGNGVIRLRVPDGVQEWYYPHDVTLVTAAPV